MKGEVLDGCLLRLAEDDTVATALEALTAGQTIAIAADGADGAARPLTVTESIPLGHKMALVAATPGDPVRKYGEVIGRASAAIAAGDHVHVHNCESARGRGDLAAGAGGQGSVADDDGTGSA